MLDRLAKSIAALSLMLTASVAAPAWSEAKGESGKKCTAAKHQHAKRSVPVAPVRSVMVVDQRKLDVQVLSFGP